MTVQDRINSPISAVRALQIGLPDVSHEGERWEVTAGFHQAWEGCATLVQQITAPPGTVFISTIAGRPYVIKPGDGHVAVLLDKENKPIAKISFDDGKWAHKAL